MDQNQEYANAEGGWFDAADRWHAADCGGSCAGCGYIGADDLWYPGPTPVADWPHQEERSGG